MRPMLTALGMCLITTFTPCVAHADTAPSSVFTQALIDGESSAPLSVDGPFSKAIAAIKQRTGDSGPVVIYASRVTTFQQQPHCGRVSYVIGQPSSHTAYRDMAGQFNICDDGSPPLRMCAGHAEKLVPYDSVCPDLSKPVDTPEVSKAISAAIAAGGMTPQQAAQMVRATQAQRHTGATQ